MGSPVPSAAAACMSENSKGIERLSVHMIWLPHKHGYAFAYIILRMMTKNEKDDRT